MTTGSSNDSEGPQGSPSTEGASNCLLSMFDPPPETTSIPQPSSQSSQSINETGNEDEQSSRSHLLVETEAEAAAEAEMEPLTIEEPPTANFNHNLSSNNIPTSPVSPATNEATASLMAMFQPPPPQPAASAPVRTGTGSSSGSGSPAKRTSTTSALNRDSASSLMAMFEPPPSATATTPVRGGNRSLVTEDHSYQSPTAPLPLVPTPFGGAISPNTEKQYTLRHENLHRSSEENEENGHTPNRSSDYLKNLSEHTSLLQSLFADENEKTPRLKKVTLNYDAVQGAGGTGADDAFQRLLAPPLQQNHSHQDGGYYVPVKQALESPSTTAAATATSALPFQAKCKAFLKENFQPTTFAGAPMFLLYHVVFCLANGSAIVRPHGSTPILGITAKLTAVGILFAGPFYIRRLGQDIPAVYPSVDLFLAPFLASAAATVDRIIAEDGIGQSTPDGDDGNAVFFASFAVLVSIGMFSAGSLLLLAAKFRLANLGSFMPYSVLCGFFSAVGVLLWALAFSVDTNGKKWQQVFFSGDLKLIAESLIHHLPSLVVGILMNILGPKHPFYVILLIIITLVSFYTTMWITGTSLEEAQEQQWFWSKEELSVQANSNEGLFGSWVPPLPFGHVGALLKGQVHWRAVNEGLSSMFVLAVLYLLRSSIHASAMKKNINNLVCKKRVKKPKPEPTRLEPPKPKNHRREPSYAKAAMDAISDNVRLVNESLAGTQNASGANQSIRPSKSPKLPNRLGSRVSLSTPGAKEESDEYEYISVRPKPCRKTLQGIFVEYGYALMLVACSGGFGVCPTVATSNTMFAIGAGDPAPQYGSVLLLIFFYMTDFDLVRYIPKACFSSLLVLGAVDTFVVWFFLSYRKTQDLTEWLVVPFIVLFSLIVGFLNAVFLGVGISTFVFVASFFRIGVVKFNATGWEIRSTVERSVAVSDWLDMHGGEYIQVLVLQNYLFFGNASSILNYIATMFEEVEGSDAMTDLPPFPKVLIIDMSLNTGMDTSTLDIFAEIKELCKNNGCKLYLCGLSSRAKKGLSLTGVKPEHGFVDQRLVRFFTDLDTALGRAEDFIASEMYEKEKSFGKNGNYLSGLSGFQRALKLIDEQHGEEFSQGLLDLEPHTSVVELQAGERLFACDGGKVGERGLFFIESGTLKIERDAGATLTRGRSTLTAHNRTFGTLNILHARAGTLVGRQRAALKASTRGDNPMTRQFRLARIGPGWVCGAIEGASGMAREGVHIAVSDCRLHHLPFQKLEVMEKDNPQLVLALYKMLSHLMARRQEITIEQLATFHSIMSSPAHSKPLSRAAIMALKRG